MKIKRSKLKKIWFLAIGLRADEGEYFYDVLPYVGGDPTDTFFAEEIFAKGNAGFPDHRIGFARAQFHVVAALWLGAIVGASYSLIQHFTR